MIGSITLSYRGKEKKNFENFLMTYPEFNEVIIKKDLKSDNILPIIEVNKDPLFYNIDHFNGYLRTNLRHLYARINGCEFPTYFKYTQLINSIDIIKRKTYAVSKSGLSRLSVVFYLESSIASVQLVKTNILMHKLNEYSHDMKTMKDKNFKEFVYHNYTLGIYADPKNKNSKSKRLKIELKVNKSVVLKKLGINGIIDLLDKSKLQALFDEFLKRFDELTIIDEIINSAPFSETDLENLKKYTNPTFWSELTIKNKRQEKLTHKNNFLRIQNEYGLNNLKNELKKSLAEAFSIFINN
jgi:hypothetical protein